MTTHSNTPAWQMLGFAQRDMEGVAANASKIAESWWNGAPSASDYSAIDSWVFRATCWGVAAFAMGGLGYQVPHPLLGNRHEVGRRIVAAVMHYFFGSWREGFAYFGQELDQVKARAKLPWISFYREGLTVAVSLSDWASADRLLSWPGPDLKDDEGFDDRTTEDNFYQIWLAARVRGETEDAVVKERARIERGTRRRPMMLLAAADALLADDASGLSGALAKYLRHYRKNELRLTQVDLGICADGNVLWHLARRRGLGEVPLPDDVSLLICRL
jgi:hypothetical protein